jgi:hypothetical protein
VLLSFSSVAKVPGRLGHHAVSASGRGAELVTVCSGIAPASASEKERSGSNGFRRSHSRQMPSSPNEESCCALYGFGARPYPALLVQVVTVAGGLRRSKTRIHFPAAAVASRAPDVCPPGPLGRKLSDVTKSETPKVKRGADSWADVFDAAGDEALPRLCCEGSRCSPPCRAPD